ncbi:DUF4381 family protein [Methylobacterium platani]|uniref:DUF4381 domain-containing protein n=2 Tax=Methylobacterium platani TaxID=427683 RepID=A0A179SB34_9HYPH|nr:DUF4381 family protein [Methylobacterium platani]KMO21888.1 hypothetical protein SQ03_02155 [Methylobacterium platani JCM 14648]OAS24675.1 hypothetical protein A5481_13150 [Methylobacterium platani]
MPCCDEALAGLRGLHAPPDPGLVRLDILAAIVAGLALAGLAAWLWPRRRGRPIRRAALAELAAARTLPPDERRLALARLARRLARSLGVEGPAGLDARLRTDFFRTGPGRALTENLYAPGPAPDLAATEAGLARLVARLRA